MAGSHGSSSSNSNNQTAYQYEYNVGNIGVSPQTLTTALTTAEQGQIDTASIAAQQAANIQAAQNQQFSSLLGALQGQAVPQASASGLSTNDILLIAGGAMLVILLLFWRK